MNLASTDFKKKVKIFWKPFVIFFFVSLVIFNWIDVGWVFNYRAIGGIFSELIHSEENGEENDLEFSEIEILAPTDTGEFSEEEYVEEEEVVEEKEVAEVEKTNVLEIPKLNISVPLVFVENPEIGEIYEALDRGVVHFPKSVLPGEEGQTIILGHSAPPNWPKIKHDWVFSEIHTLTEGDEIIIYFNNQKLSYSVTRQIFLEKGEEVPESDLTNSKNAVLLITCWPPGKDYKRIAVEAVI